MSLSIAFIATVGVVALLAAPVWLSVLRGTMPEPARRIGSSWWVYAHYCDIENRKPVLRRSVPPTVELSPTARVGPHRDRAGEDGRLKTAA